MSPDYGRSVTLPREVVDEVEKFIQANQETLKKMGIKKISHVFERAWYFWRDNGWEKT